MIDRLVALALLATQAEAGPPPPCPNSVRTGDVAVVMLPDILDAAADRCRPWLDPDAFLLSEGGRAFGRQIRQAGAPRRADLLATFRGLAGGPSDWSDEQILQSLHEPTGEMIASLTPARCQAFNALFEALSRLPPPDLMTVVTSFLALLMPPEQEIICL